MSALQKFRILTYVYAVFAESIGSHWILSVMPVIVTNNFGESSNEQKSATASSYFIYYFLGLIFGCLMWPVVVRFVPKRECLFSGLVLQAVANYLVGYVNSFGWMCFWRFWFGSFHLVNTIGKDFLYEFVKHEGRQFVFVLRSIAVLVSSFFGPLIGYYLYYGNGMSLRVSLMWVSMFYVVSFVLFAIAFYAFPYRKPVHDGANEELHGLTAEDGDIHHESHVAKKTQISFSVMLKYIFKRKDLRDLVLGFWMIFSVYNTQMFLTVFYIETSWNDYGLGLSDREVSYLVLAVFLPIIMIFLLSGKIVPKYLPMYSMFRIVVIANMVFMLIIPAIRDFTGQMTHDQRLYLIYGLVSLFLTFNPNLISPFLNFHMNNKVPNNGRTVFNGITFIGCSLCVIAIFSTVIPLFSKTMYDPRFTQYEPYNKYICFVVLDIILAFGVFLLKKPDNERNQV